MRFGLANIDLLEILPFTEGIDGSRNAVSECENQEIASFMWPLAYAF